MCGDFKSLPIGLSQIPFFTWIWMEFSTKQVYENGKVVKWYTIRIVLCSILLSNDPIFCPALTKRLPYILQQNISGGRCDLRGRCNCRYTKPLCFVGPFKTLKLVLEDWAWVPKVDSNVPTPFRLPGHQTSW